MVPLVLGSNIESAYKNTTHINNLFMVWAAEKDTLKTEDRGTLRYSVYLEGQGNVAGSLVSSSCPNS